MPRRDMRKFQRGGHPACDRDILIARLSGGRGFREQIFQTAGKQPAVIAAVRSSEMR